MSQRVGLIALLFFLSITGSQSVPVPQYAPIVIWHGMGGYANGMKYSGIVKILRDELPGVYIKTLQIGESDFEDVYNGYFMDVNKQVDQVCSVIREDHFLQKGFNALGFSQGGQFMRAVAQRCPDVRMRTLITFGSQHQGVYGLPNCPEDNTFCDYLRQGISRIIYHSYLQQNSVQAQYWKDPRNLEDYATYNKFLADINNEGPVKNTSYARNLAAIEKFVMVRFNQDQMVRPKESSWFGFYKKGGASEIERLNETALYKEDWLGLKQLDQRGALHFLELDELHVRFPKEWFVKNIIHKYLD